MPRLTFTTTQSLTLSSGCPIKRVHRQNCWLRIDSRYPQFLGELKIIDWMEKSAVFVVPNNCELAEVILNLKF